MNKPTKEAYDQAYRMFEAGNSNGQIQEATGLNYSQMWLDRTGRLIKAGKAPEGCAAIPTEGVSNTVIGAAIVKARAADQSWGLIAVRCNMPESRVRKIFTEVSALDSRGLRIGHGGRWVADDPRFYTGADRPMAGTELDPRVSVLAQVPEGTEAPTRVLPAVAAKLAGTPKPRAPRKPRKAPVKKA